LRRNCPLKHIVEKKIERKGRGERRPAQLLAECREREVTGTGNRKHYIPLCAELSLEEAMDLF
jgi:hypothetical protein